MRKSLLTTLAVGLAGCFLIAGLGSLYSQTFTNPVTLLFLTSSTGQPIGVSPANPLPVTGGSGAGLATSANQSLQITQESLTATALGTPADSVCATATGTCSLIALQKYNNNTNPVFASQYPAGAIPITISATGTTGATTASLAASATGRTTFICGSSTRANATSPTTVTDTITGVITGTMSFSLWVAPASSGIGVDEHTFSPCVPGSAANTAINVISGAPGVGGVVSVAAWGYQL